MSEFIWKRDFDFPAWSFYYKPSISSVYVDHQTRRSFFYKKKKNATHNG